MSDASSSLSVSPAQIRDALADEPKLRARDLAAKLGIREAQLVAARVGNGVTRIEPHPDALIPHVMKLGDVMALTRNESCVIERIGTYTDYHSGARAQMVVGADIDMRFFGQYWISAFAVAEGDKRSIQVFDAAGDAVHKVHLRPESDVAAFDAMIAELRLAEQSDALDVEPRQPTEPAKAEPSRLADLRDDWSNMTDTHQFLTMVSRNKMNRLGAYRTIGAPQAVALSTDAITTFLHAVAGVEVPIMIFVGNAACIEIHSGPVYKIVPMGPWINVMDPKLNVHLRADHIAEVYLVTKPTKNGPVLSVEAFDAQGGLILQIFGSRKLGGIDTFNELAHALPQLQEVAQ